VPATQGALSTLHYIALRYVTLYYITLYFALPYHNLPHLALHYIIPTERDASSVIGYGDRKEDVKKAYRNAGQARVYVYISVCIYLYIDAHTGWLHVVRGWPIGELELKITRLSMYQCIHGSGNWEINTCAPMWSWTHPRLSSLARCVCKDIDLVGDCVRYSAGGAGDTVRQHRLSLCIIVVIVVGVDTAAAAVAVVVVVVAAASTACGLGLICHVSCTSPV